MKKLLLALGLILILTMSCYAVDGDINETENIPDVAAWKLDTVRFLVFTKTCIVRYRKVDASGNPISEVKVLFRDVDDDPETPEDETLTEFTDLVTAINNGSNIKNTIKNAVILKLGL